MLSRIILSLFISLFLIIRPYSTGSVTSLIASFHLQPNFNSLLPVDGPEFCFSTGRRTLRLRGGVDVTMSDAPSVEQDPRKWKVSDVQDFIEKLRTKLGEKTDLYLKIFSENDIDGNILIGLNPQKLESLGIRSLGHREYLFEEIQTLKAKMGMMRGPRPGEFELAMAAQNAPSAHPPVKIAAEAAPSKTEEWTTVERVGWDQKDREIEYYVFIDGVGEAAKDTVCVNITEWSVEVRVRGLNGKNLLHRVPKLFDRIRPDQSFWRVRKDMVQMLLYKAGTDRWEKMGYDSRRAAREAAMQENMSKGDAGAGLMGMMKEMWEDGDDETRRTIARAWATAEQKKARGDAPGQT